MCVTTELEHEENCKTGSEESEGEDDIESESEDAEQEVKKPQLKTNGNAKEQVTSEDSTDEEKSDIEKKANKSNSDDSPKGKITKKASTAKNDKTSEGKKTSSSDEENETDTDSKSETSDKSKDKSLDQGDYAKFTYKWSHIAYRLCIFIYILTIFMSWYLLCYVKEKLSAEKENDEPDSDSSSLPSLDDEKNSGTENKQDGKKKKTVKKERTTRDQKVSPWTE